MLGDDSDEEDRKEKNEQRSENSQTNDLSCSWGMGKRDCLGEYCYPLFTITCVALICGTFFLIVSFTLNAEKLNCV